MVTKEHMTNVPCGCILVCSKSKVIILLTEVLMNAEV